MYVYKYVYMYVYVCMYVYEYMYVRKTLLSQTGIYLRPTPHQSSKVGYFALLNERSVVVTYFSFLMLCWLMCSPSRTEFSSANSLSWTSG